MLSGNKKIYILVIFNTICLLIASIDSKNIFLWIILIIVLILNIWIIVDQERKSKIK